MFWVRVHHNNPALCNHILPRQWCILQLHPLWAERLIHAPQSPVEAMRVCWVFFRMQVVKMDLIKHRGHHYCPVSFDPGQQGLCPAKDTKINYYRGEGRGISHITFFFSKKIKDFGQVKCQSRSYHPSLASICASKMATTSAVARSQPEFRDWDSPICCSCRTFIMSPGLSLWISSM